MLKIISSNSKAVRKIFKTHKVERAFIFGSALTEKFNENSDLDLLVKFKDDIPPLEKGELWWNLHDTLRDLFKREIDIVTENSLKNPYFIKEIEKTKELIYG